MIRYFSPIRSLKSIAATCFASSILPASAAVINFTTAEGYSTGTLEQAGHPWDVVNGTTASFTVNNPGLSLGPTNAGQAIYQNGFDFTAAGSVVTSVDFSFTQTTTAVDANRSVIGMQYLANPASGNFSTTAGLFGRTLTGGFRLALGGATTAAIAESAVGITAGSDLVSDFLRLTLTLTRSATADTWTRTLSLTNLTTSTVVATTGPTIFTDAALYADTSLYNSIQNFSAANTNLSALNVQAYTFTAVPEPASSALLAGSALLLLKRRRR